MSPPLRRFVFWQIAVPGLVFLGGLAGFDRETAWSAATGALIGLVGLLYLTLQTFRVDAAREPQRAIGNLYRGVAGRMALAILLFAAAFYGLPWLQAPALFLGFALALVAQWIGSARLALELERKNTTTSRDC